MSGLRIRIPQLPESAQPNGSELIEAVQGGQSRRVLLGRASVIPIPDITSPSPPNTSALADGQQFRRKEFWPGTGVGGVDLYWDASRPVSEHNGGTIIDPAKISELNTTNKTFGTYFTPDTVSGNTGCFVVSGIDGSVFAEWFGAHPEISVNLPVFEAAGVAADEIGAELCYYSELTIGGTWSTYPDRLSMRGVGDAAKLKTANFVISGSIGDPVDVTVDVEAGDLEVTVSDASGFSSGQEIRLVSCINSNSPDAWPYAMGNRIYDFSYIAEFAVVHSISSNTLRLSRRTLFPYPTTPQADSGSRTTSVVYPVNLKGGFSWRNVVIEGLNSPVNEMVRMEFCGDIELDSKCRLDSLSVERSLVATHTCKNISLDGGDYIGPAGSAQGSNGNLITFKSSENCFVKGGAKINGGFQSVDVTYLVNNASGGGPSINCGAINTTSFGASVEPYADHPGTWGTKFNENTAHGCQNSGIRLRGRNGQANGNVLSGKADASDLSRRGIIIQGVFTSGSEVKNNFVSNFSRGIIQAGTDGDGDYHQIEFDNVIDSDISGNTITDCIEPIFLSSVPTAKISARRVRNNTIIRPLQHAITANNYSNGVTIENNTIFEVGTDASSFYAAIRLIGNSKRLTVGVNYSYNAKTNSRYIFGPARSDFDPFITDLVTFPEGDAEAFLTVKEGFSDSSAPVARMTYNSEVYTKPAVTGMANSLQTISNEPLGSGYLVKGNIHIWMDEGANTLKAQIRLSDGTFTNVNIGAWA